MIFVDKIKQGGVIMKKITLIILFLLSIGLFTSTALCSPFLACDPQNGVTMSEVEVTLGGSTQIVEGIVQVSADETAILLLDLAAFTSGNYTFRARWASADGWWSDWSATYDVTKPSMPSGLRIMSE